MEASADEFYLRYYTGHKGRFGHEFLEFELRADGKLRYANNSHYKKDTMIRKEAFVSPSILAEARAIVEGSGIMQQDDNKWPHPNVGGKQELEVLIGKDHISFVTSKVDKLSDVTKSEDPKGLRALYYLVQDLKCFVFSLIGLHFKVKPIG